MTKEQKELLLKDLCGRLPYGVKVEETKFSDYTGEKTTPKIRTLDYLVLGSVGAIAEGYSKNIIKPYLFPLSSMTEVQKEEYEDSLTYHDYTEGGWVIAKSFNDEYIVPYWLVDFCNKNHLDYRGLIEKGLAIDATGLNIYKEKTI